MMETLMEALEHLLHHFILLATMIAANLISASILLSRGITIQAQVGKDE